MTDTPTAAPVSLEATARASGVDAQAMERELTRLWERINRQAAEQGVVAMRSSVLNLVVYEAEDGVSERVRETLASLAALHPARGIVIQMAPESQPVALDAWLGLRCHVAPGQAQHVCQELVTIRARSAALRQVPGLVIPLLKRRLPTVLWWVGELPEDLREVRRAAAFADGIVVDSDEFPDGGHGLRHLWALRRALPPEIDLADLNWTRTAHWRELIAQCFDPAECRPYLRQIRRVRFELGQRADGSLAAQGRALMLTAWLATRLGWRSAGAVDFLHGTEWQLRFRSRAVDRVMVEMALHGEDDGGLSGIRSITLEAGEGESAAAFAVERADDRTVGYSRTTLPGQGPQARITGMEFPSQAELLAEELAQPVRDEVFETALAFAAPLIMAQEVGR